MFFDIKSGTRRQQVIIIPVFSKFTFPAEDNEWQWVKPAHLIFVKEFAEPPRSVCKVRFIKTKQGKKYFSSYLPACIYYWMSPSPICFHFERPITNLFLPDFVISFVHSSGTLPPSLVVAMLRIGHLCIFNMNEVPLVFSWLVSMRIKDLVHHPQRAFRFNVKCGYLGNWDLRNRKWIISEVHINQNFKRNW